MRGTLNGNNWSTEQIHAIELFADGKNCKEVAEEVGVIPGTISRWRRNPQFIEAIIDAAKIRLRGELPELYSVAVSKAKAGSHPHLRIILDHLDNLEKSRRSTGELTFTWDIDEHDQDQV